MANFQATYNITDKLTASAMLNYNGITGKGRYGTGYNDKNMMTNFRQWWETNVALNPSDSAYTIPFRMTSIDGGLTWNAPQNIADLPDAPAKIIPVGAN